MKVYNRVVGKCRFFTVPDPLGVGWVGHVRPRRLLHGLLVELVFGQGNRPQRADPQRRGDADL